MKIYFAASITGGRIEDVFEMIQYLQTIGCNILSEHVGAIDPKEMLARKIGIPKIKLKPSQILKQDIKWVEEADCMIAEVSSQGSYGVGAEIHHFCLRRRLGLKNAPLLLLYRQGNHPNSAFILGRKNSLDVDVWLEKYRSLDEAKKIMLKFLNSKLGFN